MIKIYTVNGIDCAACAAKIESKISKIKGIESCVISFMSKKMSIEFDKGDPALLYPEIVKACQKVCKDTVVTER